MHCSTEALIEPPLKTSWNEQFNSFLTLQINSLPLGQCLPSQKTIFPHANSSSYASRRSTGLLHSQCNLTSSTYRPVQPSPLNHCLHFCSCYTSISTLTQFWHLLISRRRVSGGEWGAVVSDPLGRESEGTEMRPLGNKELQKYSEGPFLPTLPQPVQCHVIRVSSSRLLSN